MAVDRFMEADDRIVRTRTPWENLHKPTRLSLSRVVGGPGPTTDIDMGLSDLIWFHDTSAYQEGCCLRHPTFQTNGIVPIGGTMKPRKFVDNASKGPRHWTSGQGSSFTAHPLPGIDSHGLDLAG
ncbi:hypothetical protein AFLA70_266g001951 [Aspergillus flavus AF70]|nr:hypothetical protein AFLA70_266g001951 [Aspergillus flavus AF70]